MLHVCTVCGTATSYGSRCRAHRRLAIGSNSAIHHDPRWTALSRREIARHVGQYGWVCPGESEHQPHPSTSLSLDHIIPLESGGAPFDRANTRVLCLSWNATLGARLVNAKRRGQIQPVNVVTDERAKIRARYI